MDLSLKRRAVYTGLRPFLSDKALEKSLQLWQDEYSEDASYAFTEFLSVCCDTEELKKKRTRILSSLLRSMEASEHELLPDPLEFETGKITIENSEEVIKLSDSTTIVFERFFDNLLKQCGEPKAKQVRTYVLNQVENSKLNVLQRKYLNDWLEQSAKQLKGDWKKSHLRQLVNYCYVALCEYFGPVKADQFLAQAVAETEAFAQDKKINLHDLL